MVPGGNLAKASSFGAKTVKGPGLLSASTKLATCTAVTKVWNEPAPTAISTISGIVFYLIWEKSSIKYRKLMRQTILTVFVENLVIGKSAIGAILLARHGSQLLF
jgi:hypothetical protein